MDELAGLIIPMMAIGMVPFIIWSKMHYNFKTKSLGQMSEDQMAELERMSRTADILDQRVNVLESILDDEVPNWRENNDKTI
jgi:phage shock protein B